jgi:hypothetical protein
MDWAMSFNSFGIRIVLKRLSNRDQSPSVNIEFTAISRFACVVLSVFGICDNISKSTAID